MAKFDQRPCTIVQGLLPDFGATLKIHKKSNFDWNQLKLYTQHKYMYMYMYVHSVYFILADITEGAPDGSVRGGESIIESIVFCVISQLLTDLG